MDLKTVKRLNFINKDFYSGVAASFNSSRQYSWEGWGKMYRTMAEKDIKFESVLDIGCGNGRFLTFLEELGWRGKYLGIDNSSELKSYFEKSSFKSKAEYKLYDILDLIPDGGLGKFDLVVCFGVIHHIPSFQNRLKLMKLIKNSLNDKGVAIVAIWKFLDEEKYKKRLISWDRVGIDPTRLEENDYLLDWKRGGEAIRYCHFVDEAEEKELITKSELKQSDSFDADGKSGRLNRYVILSCDENATILS